MCQANDLASGRGIAHRTWPKNVVFCQNIMVDLSCDFEQLLEEAKLYDSKYDNSKGNRNMLLASLVKLKAYQEHRNMGSSNGQQQVEI